MGSGDVVGEGTEAVADGFDARDAAEVFEEIDRQGHDDDGDQCTGQFLIDTRGDGDDQYGDETDEECGERHGVEVGEISHPLADEIGGDIIDLQAKEVDDLCGEDGQGDTAGEADNDGIRDELDDRAEFEETEEHENDTSHESGDGEAGEAVVADDVVDDDDEGAGGASDLYAVTAESRDQETADDGRDETHSGGDAAGDTEGDGEREGNDADHYTGYKILLKLLKIVILEFRDELRLKLQLAR